LRQQTIWQVRCGARQPPRGEHEKRNGQHGANWPDWYAAYMTAEQAGTEPPM